MDDESYFYVPELWGILKQTVYKEGWEATNEQPLQRQIKECVVDWAVVQVMLERVKTNS